MEKAICVELKKAFAVFFGLNLHIKLVQKVFKRTGKSLPGFRGFQENFAVLNEENG